MQDRYLRIALAQIEEGHYVFPCLPGTKRPAVQHWASWATLDPDKAERYWFGHDYPVAVACGPSGVLVLDPDRKNGVLGDWNLHKWFVDNGLPVPPPTRIVVTPSGGSHLWFRRPPGLRLGNSTGTLPEGVDVRGVGGYVLVEGNRLPQGEYRRHPKSAETIDVMPRQLIEALTPKPVDRRDLPVRTDLSRYGRRPLEEELAAVAGLSEGTRNQGLFSAARKLGSLLGAGVYDSREYLEDELLGASGKTRPPMNQGEALKTIRSGLDWGEAHPRHLTSVGQLGL